SQQQILERAYVELAISRAQEHRLGQIQTHSVIQIRSHRRMFGGEKIVPELPLFLLPFRPYLGYFRDACMEIVPCGSGSVAPSGKYDITETRQRDGQSAQARADTERVFG